MEDGVFTIGLIIDSLGMLLAQNHAVCNKLQLLLESGKHQVHN